MDNILENVTKEEVLAMIDNFPIKPMSTKIIATINSEVSLKSQENEMEDVQYVVAVGDEVKEVSPGDSVILDITRIPNACQIVKVGDFTFQFLTEFQINAIDNR